MTPLLEVRDLNKVFSGSASLPWKKAPGIRAVDGVSLSLQRGETLGLVGESGSGKTTLGRMILRLLEADSGEIIFDGTDLLALSGKRLKPFRRRMQAVFQDPYGSLNPRMKVGAIVAEGLEVFRVSDRRGRRERVAELLKLVGLPEAAAERYPHEFSGGQRQRIGIARALALEPDFLLCDEPVSSLDVSVQAQVLNLISDLRDRMGLTCLFIAHDLGVVEHMADRVAVMYRGRIVEEGPAAAVYSDPRHPYTRLLLDSIPVPDPAAAAAGAETGEDRPAPPPEGCSFRPRCPRALEECARLRPELTAAGPGRKAACFRADRG